MNIEIRRASKVVAQWFLADEETLVIYLADDLDEVARQRYIAEAKAEHGITDERHRRGIIPLLPISWGHTASHGKTVTTIAAGGGVLIVGVAAAIVLPAVLRNDSQPPAHRPRVAAPARPPSPPKAQRPRREAPPSKAPTRPRRTEEPPRPGHLLPEVAGLHLPSVPRRPIGRTLPVGGGGSVPAPPHLPKPPAPPASPPATSRPLLRVDLPPVVSASVRLSPRLQLRIHIGSSSSATDPP